jgi:hypothetical protein
MNLDEFKENIRSAFKEVEEEYLGTKNSCEEYDNLENWIFI